MTPGRDFTFIVQVSWDRELFNTEEQLYTFHIYVPKSHIKAKLKSGLCDLYYEIDFHIYFFFSHLCQ